MDKLEDVVADAERELSQTTAVQDILLTEVRKVAATVGAVCHPNTHTGVSHANDHYRIAIRGA